MTKTLPSRPRPSSPRGTSRPRLWSGRRLHHWIYVVRKLVIGKTLDVYGCRQSSYNSTCK